MAAPSSPAAAALTNNSTAAAECSDDVTRPPKRLKPREEESAEQHRRGHLISSSSSLSSSVSSSRCINSSSSSLDNNSSAAAAGGDNSSNDGGGPSSIDLCFLRLFHALPQTLIAANNNSGAPAADKVSAFRSQWINHGFRTTVVSSPRCAVSIYLDSCGTQQRIASSNEKSAQDAMHQEAGRQFLLTCIAMHTHQLQLEDLYKSVVQKCWCFKLFLDKLACVREADMREESVCDVVNDWKDELDMVIGGGKCDSSSSKDAVNTLKKKELMLQELSDKVPSMLSTLIVKLTDISR